MKDYFVMAGGCFWCVAMPFYQENGVFEVVSGYIGGAESDAEYQKVKSQQTAHREAIKIEYDPQVLSFERILQIFFETIDPFDDMGQFIDRGQSYTTALYYKNQSQKEQIENYVKKIERESKKTVATKILPDQTFFNAEQEHQNFALKNPEKMQLELEQSGRLHKKIDK